MLEIIRNPHKVDRGARLGRWSLVFYNLDHVTSGWATITQGTLARGHNSKIIYEFILYVGNKTFIGNNFTLEQQRSGEKFVLLSFLTIPTESVATPKNY